MRPRLHDRLIIACEAFSCHRSLAYHSNRLIFAFGNNFLRCSGGAWLTFFLRDFPEPQRRQFFTVLRARRFSRVSSWLLLQSDNVNIVELVVYELMQIFLSQPQKLSSPKKWQKISRRKISRTQIFFYLSASRQRVNTENIFGPILSPWARFEQCPFTTETLFAKLLHHSELFSASRLMAALKLLLHRSIPFPAIDNF